MAQARPTGAAAVAQEREIQAIERELAEEEPITFDVKACARCYGDHGQVEFRPLTHPLVIWTSAPTLTHWAPCPANGEPILMVVGVET